eukprot:TRINITY_DN7444_c0_g1_i4.p1 TRINITY_DN7444_c0_g1~~TRINITY_DN7444_c0_g1_i4.p1  ORF type:complete len:258 (+),score=56.10 TRINITY_DN7444_c0_g1_i4:72-845(+)
MAKSKFEYVKQFEQEDPLLPHCWIVIRLDGRAFHKFSDTHEFEKPNDIAALNLMNECALACCKEFQDVVIAYGESDEYSFVLKRDAKLWQRRASKIMTAFASFFASNYVFHWSKFFPSKQLIYPPTFDARCVLYPSVETVRDYLSWRQADCHINNLYNTCFWNLVKSGVSKKEAEEKLSKTLAEHKNELLFSQFGINYNTLPQLFRKGSVILKKVSDEKVVNSQTGEEVPSQKKRFTVVHEDIISNKFWEENSGLLK